MAIVAMLGATISPCLFFWQTGQGSANKMLYSQYRRNSCEISMNSRIQAASLRFSQIVSYPLYCQRAPRSKILRGA
jgi:Mn2+/Fe2+ NRAMP family transporter